jgi:probable phosphoglycerate mutase
MAEVWLIRHGETDWSAEGRHTGRTDVALTEGGRRQAEQLRQRLSHHPFSLVLTSPLRRARDTCNIAGFADRALEDADLCEWDYGSYEGRTSAEIRTEHPGWEIWDDGVLEGESIQEVGERADRVLRRVLQAPADCLLFAHGHFLRIFAARWLGLPPASGRLLALGTAAISVLGYERENRVLRHWNTGTP